MKESGVEAREIAIQCLYRIDETDSFANIILPNLLKGKSLDQRDKNLITEIVYGATRMRRSLDWVIDRYLSVPPPTKVTFLIAGGCLPNTLYASSKSCCSERDRLGIVKKK
ncbi:MAG: hypothetical protein Ct9H90mP11_03010 [Acidimicrobiales bacterium]|nr:MAG: hypothetical protein Ct9H90mP11_03010 [Acidimicrobiales bacterium]